MHHEIRFTDGNFSKNTWSDWGLMAMQQPTFVPPAVKRKILEIPGGDGIIDLSEAVTGYPVYANREGNWSFLTPKASEDFLPIYNQVMEYLHGQSMIATLPDDDPGYYYEGRFWVDSMACDRLHGVIAIGYSVGPYKWAMTATNEPWLWDPFSFETGVIGNGVFEAAFSASEDVTAMPAELAWTAQETGNAFFHPKFTVTGDADVILEIRAGNETRLQVTLAHGETVSVPRLALTEGRWLYMLEPVQVYVSTASGTATLGIAASVNIQNADVYSHIEVTDEPLPLAFTEAETGAAPQKVIFSAAGAAVTLTATTTDASPITFMETIPAGSSAPMTGLVLYRGTWLYNGGPAALTAATASGTATLALTFRQGRL